MQALPTRSRSLNRIIAYLLFTAVLFLSDSLFLFLFLFSGLCIAAFFVPFRILKAGWLPIGFFLFFTFASNLIGQPGRIVFSLGDMLFTEEGLRLASIRTMRILLMIGGVKIFIASAKTDEMLGAIGMLFRPLERFGIPVKDFFHAMSLTVICLPRLKKGASEQYRAHRPESATRFVERARAVTGFLLPFFLRSLRSPELFFESGEDRRR